MITVVKRDGRGIPDLDQFVLDFPALFLADHIQRGSDLGIDDEHAVEAIKQHVITGTRFRWRP